MSETQAALPGLEVETEEEWLLTVDQGGLEYYVIVEAMTHREARNTFHEEFELYEMGIEDDEFDDTHEAVFARSKADAEAILLERDRSYMRVYDWSCLGNTAEVLEAERLEDTDGWAARQRNATGGWSPMPEHYPSMVNAFVIVNPDDGSNHTFDGPFDFTRDGGRFEVALPIGTGTGTITDDEAETIVDASPADSAKGKLALALADGGVEGSGVIVAADRLESDILVAVDDPLYLEPSDVDFDRSEVDA